jgi:acetylornithine deacetylase/succinyl-diaminopimelate desuccinylase family protein
MDRMQADMFQLTNNDAELIELLANLVRIKSVNPNYADGVPELACGEFIEDYLRTSGLAVWRQEVFHHRPNILARLPGKDRSRQIIFEAHIDTVSTQGMTIDPFEPRIEGENLFGRGSCDTKGGLAAMMHALSGLAREGVEPPCNILLAAAIDEEYSYRGVLALCAGDEPRELGQAPRGQPLKAQLAVVAEPTSLRLVVASKGVLRWKIETIGKAAHSSKPHLGRNAIVAMARVIDALQADSHQLNNRSHPLLGAPTLNIGVIQGGVQVNFVPERCVIEIDRRLIPGETWQAAFEHYQKLVDRLMAQDSSVEIVMHPPMLTDLPLDCPSDSPEVLQLSTILASMNLNGQPLGVPFGSDASKFAAIGIPSIIFGPGSIDQAHAAVEFVDCQQVITASKFYRQVMLSHW